MTPCLRYGVWCRTMVELPHHEGGLSITPLSASGMAAFYSATAKLVSWLGSLPHASQWVAGQTLDDPTTWLCSALETLKQLHGKLLTLYNCSEWAPPPPAGPAAAPAPDAGHDDDNAHPLSLRGLMGRSWASFGCDAPRTTATVTEQDYGAFFRQFFGFTNNPALAPLRAMPLPAVLNGR